MDLINPLEVTNVGEKYLLDTIRELTVDNLNLKTDLTFYKRFVYILSAGSFLLLVSICYKKVKFIFE